MFCCSTGCGSRSILTGVVAIAAGPAESAKPADAKAAVTAWDGDPWPLDTCIVAGEKLGSMGEPVVYIHEGREVKMCCAGCVDTFKAEPAKYLKAADERIIKQQSPHYPLTNCVVQQDEALPEGAATETVVGNRLVRTCCKGCARQVKKDPTRFIAALDAAVIAQQKDAYPLTTCVIAGEPLGANPVERVYGVSLVRFCCEKCAAKFEKNPAAGMAKLHQAWSDKHADPAH
jgi:YHS domain-containing protein